MRAMIPLIALLLSGPAHAAGLTLPGGAIWCEPRDQALARFEGLNELSDDMVDASGTFAGVDGFFRLVFEEGKLLSIRFRFFGDDADNARVRKALEGMMGAGTQGKRGTRWSPGDDQSVELKGSSEQVYVQFEVPLERCSEPTSPLQETEREKADRAAMERKPDPTFDPYSMDDDPDKPLIENKKKKAEEKKKAEKKKKEADVGDGDIDW